MPVKSKKVLIVHGPNLNLLGRPETAAFGQKSLAQINQELEQLAASLGVEVKIVQSNHEGVIIDEIQQAEKDCGCIVINPGGFTHYSIAVREALAAVVIPSIEVHLSNIFKGKEEYMRNLVTAPAVHGLIIGFGADSYLHALEAAAKIINKP